MPRGRFRPTALPLFLVLILVPLPASIGMARGGPALAESEPQPVGAVPAPSDVDALMSHLAGSGGVRARFRETRYVSWYLTVSFCL